MGNSYGQKWLDGDQGTRQRRNWKTIVVDTGANISALDYTTGLVSRYSFASDGSDSQGANTLTLTGSPTFVAAIYGNGMQLDGATQFAQAASSSVFDQTTTAFGFSVWLQVIALPASKGYIVSKRNDAASTNVGYDVYVNSSGQIVVELSDGTTLFTYTSSQTLSTATWYHITVYFNRGTNIQLYINAISDGTVAQGTTTTITNTQVFTVGRHSNTSSSFLNAVFDQLQIFNSSGALNTLANVQQIYSDCHSGMVAFCEYTGSGFTGGQLYQRNAENTAWLAIPEVQSKTISTGDILRGLSSGVYDRLAMGSANQVLSVNAGGTDLAWATVHYQWEIHIIGTPYVTGNNFLQYFGLAGGNSATASNVEGAVTRASTLSYINIRLTANTLNAPLIVYYGLNGTYLGTLSVSSGSTGIFTSSFIGQTYATGDRISVALGCSGSAGASTVADLGLGFTSP